MASRVALQVGRQVMYRSRCVPIRVLCASGWRPSTQFLSSQNHLVSVNVARPAPASLIHTSAVRSSSHIVTIQDDKDFSDRVLHSETPVIVDFFATWCGPCKVLIPRLESLVSGKDGKVVLVKIDIDQHTDLAMDYEVSAVPTVLAMKDGKVIDKFVGLKDEADLETFVAKLTG